MAADIGVQIIGIEQLVRERQEGLDSLIPAEKEDDYSSLRSHIIHAFNENREARENGGVNRLLMEALRAYNGQYDPEDEALIASEGGSRIFMNLTSTKCRAAISWIKDILLAGKQDAFGIEPTPVVELPEGVAENIKELITKEFDKLMTPPAPPPVQQGPEGQPPVPPPAPPPDIAKTVRELNEYKRDLHAAIMDEINKEAAFEFKKLELKIKDRMKEGCWDRALSEFIDDFCIFPTAFLKGPIVTRKKRLKWERGVPVASDDYVFLNKRVSPLDIYPAPEASSVQDGNFIEHIRLSRKELSSFMRAGEQYEFKSEAIRKVLENDEGKGIPLDTNIEDEKAREELREGTHFSNKNVYHGLHYWGSVAVKLLRDWGMDDESISGLEEEDTVEVEAILVGSEVIKCIINDDPLERRPYYSASFQKRPGSIWGSAPPYLMRDIQRMCNACARALANNMGLSAGPLMELVVDRLADGQDVSQLKPRDIIQTTSDPVGGSGRAVQFFTIPSVAQELLAVYSAFEIRADDVTMIPRYAYGNEKVGGAAQALANYESVLTPDGPVAICELEVGSKVCNTYGSTSKVLGVYPQGVSDIFRISFSNGKTVDCDMNHRWSVRTHHDREFITLTTEEILEKGLFRKTNEDNKNPKGYRPKWMIPHYSAVDYPEREVSIDPYTFGALLGDGDSRGRLTSMDQEVFDRVPYKLGVVDIKHDNKAWSQTILGIKPLLRSYLGVVDCYTKFIPNDYLYNSVAVRTALLKGLMDTDGCISKGGESFYFTTSKQLSEDFRELVESLGGTVKSIQVRDDKREGRSLGYRIHFYTDFCPCYLQRKADNYKVRERRYTYITGVEYVGKHEATCIEVDSKDSCFLVDNFIVTHNTASGLSMLLESANKGIKDAIRHIDEGLIIPRIQKEFYMTLLAGDYDFSGDINVIAYGSQMLTMAGAEQMRRNEFLQVTANPMDQEIMGPLARAEILRIMARDLNLGEDLIPNRQELKALMKKKEESQQAPPPQVQAAQIQNDTILQIAQERNALQQADLQRKAQKDQQDVAIRAAQLEQEARNKQSDQVTRLQAQQMKTASQEHQANQKIAVELQGAQEG